MISRRAAAWERAVRIEPSHCVYDSDQVKEKYSRLRARQCLDMCMGNHHSQLPRLGPEEQNRALGP